MWRFILRIWRSIGGGDTLTYNGYKIDVAILSNAQDGMGSLSAMESRMGLAGAICDLIAVRVNVLTSENPM